jgi:hypothetical protein
MVALPQCLFQTERENSANSRDFYSGTALLLGSTSSPARLLPVFSQPFHFYRAIGFDEGEKFIVRACKDNQQIVLMG